MTRYGSTDFRIKAKYYFQKHGDVQSANFHVYHDDDRVGIDFEIDYEFDCEDALTDLVEWAYRLGKESNLKMNI